jgi:hypothetical protein
LVSHVGLSGSPGLPCGAPRIDNSFKLELARRTVIRALQRGAS